MFTKTKEARNAKKRYKRLMENPKKKKAFLDKEKELIEQYLKENKRMIYKRTMKA